jgi:hypothetical protein
MMTPRITWDWKFRLADWVKIGVLLFGIGAAYGHLQAEQKTLSDRVDKMEAVLAQLMAEQTATEMKATEVLAKIELLLAEFPPHRHTRHGDIIYALPPGDHQ